MGDKPLYWCNIMISDEDTISWSSCWYNFDQVVNLQMFSELQRCAQMCRICGAKWPINFRGFLEQLLLSVDALQRYMGSWIIIVDTRSGSLPSYHLIMSNTDRPDKPDCWLLTMLQPNESQHGMLLKGLQRDANLCTGASCTWAQAWQRCSYDTVIPSTHSAVLHRPGRTAEIRLAMDLTVFDVALRSLGHPKGPRFGPGEVKVPWQHSMPWFGRNSSILICQDPLKLQLRAWGFIWRI